VDEGVTPEQLTIVRTIVRGLTDKPVFVFGSRIAKKAQKNSDLDLCLKDSEKMDLLLLGEIREKLQESNLPFIIDLADYNRMPKEYQKEVDRTSVPL